ncbi:amino acid/amide ABC transporter membrane protein 2, HAAT family [Desulfonispora thiosulfatigenes DSM 11270]|uniref:Amino acid/amide ABC transporter membrane protein 2, HAAT family n=1 Tax=Desulfonispora thiosulfatigenes DSM 11270 TaxID=656914 RepID=A0A1W1UDZ1_DESTI|nr:branched-chain amino acid ABC transporter permease [Desulfonispora thiosulfatigenes]SMB79297.1 amino acid/amide ABC transporter membrane protein 2, HAAT family [Desulfonispora thiosulfatigenes DSM 11270]
MKHILKNMTKPVLLLATFAIVQVLISLNIINDYLQVTLALICINIIMAVSLNLVVGFTGQLSLGHAGFMAIGAYTCAIISLEFDSIVGFLIGLFAGAILASFVGFLVGIPTLRLKGDYLAIATLGLAEIIRIVFLNLEITNGAAGLSGIPQYTNWVWMFIFTAGTILIISNFINSSHGRACISIREDEIASESMGINTTKYKIIAFAMGAFFAGIAGGLYASYFYFLKPDLFGFLKSIDFLVIVVLGGLGSLSGSIIAAILLAALTTYLQAFPAIRMIIYSLLLIIIMLYRPQGIMGSKELSLEIFGKWGKMFNKNKSSKVE